MYKLVMRRYLMMGAGQYLRDFRLAHRQVDSFNYPYISCFRTLSARNFFCVSMISSSASFIGRMKTNENKEADLARRWVR